MATPRDLSDLGFVPAQQESAESDLSDLGFQPDTDTQNQELSDLGFTALTPKDKPTLSGISKQFAIGAVNEALLGIPLFALEKVKGEESRKALESDVGLERVARGVGSTVGFLAGLPAKVFVKGGQLAIKAAAKGAPALAKTGKALTTGERIAKGAIQGAGGFGAFELVKAPEDEFVEKLATVPMATALGGTFGLSAELAKPAISRFVSRLTKGNRSIFTEQLADDLITEVDRQKQQFNKLMNAGNTVAAQELANRSFQGKLLQRANQEVNAFSTDIGKRILAEQPFESVRHLAKLKRNNALKQFGVSGREHARGQGLAGSEFVRRADNALVNARAAAGQSFDPMKKSLVGLKKNELLNITDVLEGRALPLNNAAKNAAETIRRGLDDAFARGKETGLNLQFRKDFFPHVIMSPDTPGNVVKESLQAAVKRGDFRNIGEAQQVWKSYSKYIKDGNIDGIELGKHRITDYIMRQRGIDERTAKDLLKEQFRRTRSAKFQNLEGERTLNLPFYDVDPRRAIPEYLVGANRRIETARQFGPNDEIQQQILEAIQQEGGDARLIKTMFNRLFGTIEEPELLRGVTNRQLQAVRNFEVVTKLGLAAIPNATQSINTVFVTGLKNTLRGIGDAIRKQGREFADITGSTLSTTIDDLARRSTGGASSFTSRFLRLTGFNATETMNRAIAANAGKHFVEGMTARLLRNNTDKRALRALREVGLDPKKIIKRGGLEFDELVRASQRIVNKSQFQSTALDLPIFFTSPEGRVLTQFKTFAFNQAKLMKDAVMMEARRGNLAPIISAVTLMPILGEGVADVRSVLTGRKRDAKGLERIAENIGNVGSLGILSDLWNAARFGKVADFLVGPFVSDVADISAGVQQLSEGKPNRLINNLTRKVPLPFARRVLNQE